MTFVPPIFVLHGALGSASQMSAVADALRQLSTVHVVEWPGHGDTPLPENVSFSIAAFADTLAHHIQSLASAPPLAFGHSMGGYVALALEARAPGTFAGIVTLGTKFDWTPGNAEREASRLDPDVIRAKVPKFADTLEARHHGAGGWRLVLERTASLLRSNADAPLLTRDSLAQIAAPVTVAVGTRDETVSWDETCAAANAMPHGTCIQLPDVAHPIERVPADLVVNLIQKML